MRLGPTEAIELFVGPTCGPIRFGFNQLIWTSRVKFQAQKSPQGLCRAGFQDFISRLW